MTVCVQTAIRVWPFPCQQIDTCGRFCPQTLSALTYRLVSGAAQTPVHGERSFQRGRSTKLFPDRDFQESPFLRFHRAIYAGFFARFSSVLLQYVHSFIHARFEVAKRRK